MSSSIATLLMRPIARPALERTRLRARRALTTDPSDVSYVLALCYYAAAVAEFASMQSDVLFIVDPWLASPYDTSTRRGVQEAYQMLFSADAIPDLKASFTELQSMGLGGEVVSFLSNYLDSTSPHQSVAAVAHVLLYAARLQENA